MQREEEDSGFFGFSLFADLNNQGESYEKMSKTYERGFDVSTFNNEQGIEITTLKCRYLKQQVSDMLIDFLRAFS